MPETIHDIQRFLVMINFYRRCLRKAAQLQAPLFRLTHGAKKKDLTPVVLTDDQRQCFEDCKKSLANAALLIHPERDAAMGAAIEQRNTVMWKPLAFFSRKFTIP